jgi:hypothetical protein
MNLEPPENLESEYVGLWWQAVRILYSNCGAKAPPRDKQLPIVASLDLNLPPIIPPDTNGQSPRP